MNGGKIVILHLVFDGILFDQVYPFFEEMDNYENRYLLGNVSSNQQFKHIKNTEKIMSFDAIEPWCKTIADPSVDVLYLHGLWIDYLKAIDYIGDHVVVMWWCYGMEIYENLFGRPPLLPIKIYKPRTHWIYLNNMGKRNIIKTELFYSFPRLSFFIKKYFDIITGKKDDKLERFLSRIDYAWTPLEIELEELKKRNPYIKAKPFSLRKLTQKFPLNIHSETGNILLEHSANISNNHLDIISLMKKKRLVLKNRNIFIPLGYGIDSLAKQIEKKAVFNGANVHCLMKSLPIREYGYMMTGCSHAIFGMMRQSGLGTINMCFRKGIKVFFYKDSVLYKQFKSEGYYVYSIEDDLNDTNIKEPLSPMQAINNYNKYYSTLDGKDQSYQEQLNKILHT